MSNGNVHKVWGERRRLLLTDQTEIDLLYLKKDSFCSWHKHKTKINRFYVIEGEVCIKTEFGEKIIKKDQNFEVQPPLKHKFIAIKPSTMIEMAFVKENFIQPNDIYRYKLGGLIIDGKEYTLPQLKKKGLLNL